MTFSHSKVRSFSMGSWNELEGTHCMEIDIHLAYNQHSGDIVQKVCGKCAKTENYFNSDTVKRIDNKTVKWIHINKVYFQRGECKIPDEYCDKCNLKYIKKRYQCQYVNDDQNTNMGEISPPLLIKNKGNKNVECRLSQ